MNEPREATLSILLNGEARELPAHTTVEALVQRLGLRPELVAVERNATIVRRSEHARCELEAGDRLEIVTLVGGG